ncbi:MAG TPA: SusC/RagA family TonB-linked outer membrane protein [Gemmatimonadaceae bacterium]|nr:SusC/RagA family TonB-linked outer membrane protein [Gemmatimonadaceae bacterium]
MRLRSASRAFAIAVCLSAAVVGTAPGQDSPNGRISGRVLDAVTGQPVAAAQVNVVGTQLGSITNSDGVYTIRGVTPGSVEVRVLRVGYAEQRQAVTVTANVQATADFRMTAVAMSLSPVVTTATGDQRRVEVGNAIAQVDAAEVVATSAVTNMGDLLASRAAGVMVTPGTQTGAGIRIRIRGTSSLSLDNAPIYIIDGIRMEGTTGSSSVSVGGTTASRIGDLNPEEIESMEIIRGPSAATLYGTDAANGVVVITTKRGVAGAPQWTYYTEQTAIADLNSYPTAYRGWRTGSTNSTNSTPSNTVQCFLSQVAAGSCVQDSLTSFNLHEDDETTPYGIGYRQQHGLQIGGGSEAVRYFLHGEWESEDGVTKLPDFEKRYLARHNIARNDAQKNPNALTRITTRANLNFAPADAVNVAVSAGYISSDLRLARSDDSGTAGIAANTYGGPGMKYNLNAAGDTLFGWREFTPRDVYETETRQAIERFITSTNANWSPMNWLSFRGNIGVDYINRLDTQLCRFEDCTSASNREGFKEDNRTNFFIYTTNVGATATRQLTDRLASETAVGVQYYRNVFDRNGAFGRGLPPGATTVTAGAEQLADETTSETRTLGAYVEQRLAFSDRLFLTGAIRSDRNSAFGADFKTVFYPKLSASWVISEEPFFGAPSFINQLRLRSAYGASGVQPGTIDAVQYYSPTTVLGESGEEAGLVFSTLGNSKLKPERSTELEVGVDGSFWNNRLSLELTYYNKSSKDALIDRILPPSLGSGSTSRLENLGEVRNRGVEMLLNAEVIRAQNFGWDVTLNGSMNRNKLISLGGVPPIIGSTSQQREGYPLNGWWQRRLLGWDDKNGNGIIEYDSDDALSEIMVSEEREYHGSSMPLQEFAVTNGFEFWNRRLRFSAMLDYKGGHLIYNNTERIRCSSRNNCSGLINPNASFFEQARTTMIRQHPSRSQAGFFEEGDFIRFRELSLTLNAPEEWSRVLHGRNIVATLAARNLGMVWTKYTGVDPEAFGTTGDAPSSFQAFAPPSYFTFRISLGF